jgi:large subunit ribosomal protein L44e
MKISKEMRVYCPKCNKHTEHTVRLYSKKPASGLSIGTRRAARKRVGFVGKVKGQATVQKLAKRQKVLMECKVCKRNVERVITSRVKKKLEIKA